MKKQMKLTQKGFTLIEMLIVMAIVSILVVLVLPNAADTLTKANSTACDALKTSLEADALATKASTGSYPTSVKDEDQKRVSKVCTGQTATYTTDGKIQLTNSSTSID